jgi:glycosyltransferase involved in cell wall biosynthesis
MAKLLVISQGDKGGVVTYATEIIKHFRRDKDVYVGHETQYTIPFAYKRSSKSSNRYIRVLQYLCSLFIIFLRCFFKKYNQVVIFSSADPFSYCVLRICLLTNTQSYFVVHDGIPHVGDNISQITYNRYLFMQAHANNLVFLSEYVRELVKNNLKIDKPYVIIPHGLIDLGETPSSRKVHNGKPKILFFGRLSVYKGVNNLINAVQKMDDSKYEELLVIGTSVKGFHPKNTNNPKIRIKEGFVSDEVLASLLNEYDILVMPYLEASQSGVATLAINYLIPTIATDVGGIKEQLGDCALYAKVNDENDLKNKIELLCFDKDAYERLADCLFVYRDKFSWENLSKKLEEYLRDTKKI